MPRRVRPGDAITADLFNALQEEVRRLGSVSVSGLTMHNGPGGLAFGVAFPDTGIYYAVVTTAITAAPNANTLGQGVAKLRVRGVGAASLTDGATGLAVYSHFSTAVAVGKRILISREPDGNGWILVSGDCP
jgi:hypothetical protein